MVIVKCPVCYGEGCNFCDWKGELDSTLTVWGHLQDAPLKSHYFPKGSFPMYWGSFLEKLGRRVLRETLPNEFYSELFPNVEIIASDNISPSRRGRIKKRDVANLTADFAVILHCKGSELFEKNAVLFEIKSSMSPISDGHIRKWKDWLTRPENYINKCKRARLFILWIHGLDIEARNIFYTLKEFVPSEIPNHFKERNEAESMSCPECGSREIEPIECDVYRCKECGQEWDTDA